MEMAFLLSTGLQPKGIREMGDGDYSKGKKNKLHMGQERAGDGPVWPYLGEKGWKLFCNLILKKFNIKLSACLILEEDICDLGFTVSNFSQRIGGNRRLK